MNPDAETDGLDKTIRRMRFAKLFGAHCQTRSWDEGTEAGCGSSLSASASAMAAMAEYAA